jgi:hypothetical protein
LLQLQVVVVLPAIQPLLKVRLDISGPVVVQAVQGLLQEILHRNLAIKVEEVAMLLQQTLDYLPGAAVQAVPQA